MEGSYGFPSNYLQSTLGLVNSYKNFVQKYEPICIKFYYLHVAISFRARKLLQNFVQKYELVLRFRIDPISNIYMLQSTLGLEDCYKNL